MARNKFLKNLLLTTVILLSACQQQGSINTSSDISKEGLSSGSIASMEYRLEPQTTSRPVLSSSVCGINVPESKCPIISPPFTSYDLLNNIKNAIALNIFMNDEIFSNDKMLWNIFATRQFYKEYPFKADSLNVRAGTFPASIDRPSLHSTNPRIHITKSLVLRKDGKRDIVASFYLHQAGSFGLSFEEVEKVFGTDWKPYEVSLPPEIKVHNSSAEALSGHIMYKIKSVGRTTEIGAVFDDNKQLQSLSINIQE